MKIVEVKNVSKFYFVTENKNLLSYFTSIFKKNTSKKIVAVDKISFDVNLGESVGFIGRNGAGKSTTIKMLTGILKPSAGEINVFGRNPFKYRQKNNYNIGAVFGQRCQLRWDISAYESYKLLKYIYKIPEKIFKETLNELTELLELDEILYQPVRTLSLGQKMRVELCSAFLHRPQIVFLDEPTIGLDIFSKTAILNFLKKAKKDFNTTIFLTTHDTDDIEFLCDRTIIIEKGKIIYDGPTDSIANKINIGNRVLLTFENRPVEISRLIDENMEVELDGNKIIIKNVTDKQLPDLLHKISEHCNVKEIKVQNPKFEEVLKEFYKIEYNEGVKNA